MKNNEFELRQIFSKNLKVLMEERKINNVELSRTLKLTESAVGKWLLGKSLPRMGTIEIIANYFNVNKTDLLEQKPKSIEDLNTKGIKRLALKYESDEFSQEAIDEIQNFIDYVKSKEESKKGK